ncbi:MAG TPA: hypothetical protein VGM07_03350 [Stellaceae bacterium]|jgi:hypothetical protein
MHSWYEFFRDQGSVIAGLLALLAGGFAYCAGVKQAKETRESADKQIAAMTAERTNADAAASEAVRREILEFSKIVREALCICECIRSGALKMSRKNAYSIMSNPDPIVYKAIADRISRMPYDPQLVVSFYAHLAYTQQTIQIIVVGAPGDDIPAMEVEKVAENLITTCKLARVIISNVPSVSIDEQVTEITLAQIDTALESAKRSFPKLFMPRCARKQSEGDG